jgi:hypothetical protein
MTTSGMAVPDQDPEHQVIAMFRPGVIQLPSGNLAATLQNTVVTSEEVADLLQDYEVESIAKAIPEFNPADSLGISRTGDLVRLTDYSEVYRLVLSSAASARELVAELLALHVDVAYAHLDAVPHFFSSCVYDESFGGGASVCPES